MTGPSVWTIKLGILPTIDARMPVIVIDRDRPSTWTLTAEAADG